MADFAQSFIQGQLAGQAAKQNRERHAQDVEENSLRKMILKLQMDQMKVSEAVNARKLDQERLQFLEGRPASELPKLDAPTEMMPGNPTMEMAQAPIRIRGVNGNPDDFVTPQSAEQLGEQARMKSLADIATDMAKKRYEASLKPIPEGAAVPDGQGGYTIPAPKAAPAPPRPAPLEQQLLDAMKSGDKQAEQMIRGAMNARDQKPSGDLSPTVQRLVQTQAKGFEANPIVKKTQTMAEAVEFADGLDIDTKNPADDQALIYAFAKAMDPDSVVREGEYNTVQKYGQSWAERFGFDVKRMFSNTSFLTREARKNMKDTIRGKYAAGRKQYDNVRKEYGRKIERITKQPGGDAELVDFAAAFPSVDAPAPSGGGSQAAQVGERRTIQGQLAEWDGKGWKPVR